MMDKALRVPKEKLMQPLAKRLQVMSPTALTGLGLAIGLAAALVAALGQPLFALGLWVMNRLVDGLDGELARATGRQSDLGGYLDIMADLAVYAAIPLGLTYAQGDAGGYLALAVMLSLFYVNTGSWMYLSAVLEKRAKGARSRGESTSVTMPAGLIEGTETVIFYSLFLLFPEYASGLFWLLSLLVGVTVFQRILWAQRKL